MERSPKFDSAAKDEKSQEEKHELPGASSARLGDAGYNGNIPVLRESIDESDGQRRSLSLDDDGGTHFDNSDSLETVVRRGGSLREENIGGTNFRGAFEDNDVMFNPAQRLNFDESDDDEEDEMVEENNDVGGFEGDGDKENVGSDEDEEAHGEEEMVDDSDREDDNDEVALVVQSENNEPEDGSDYLHHRPWVSGSDLVEDSAPMAVGLAQSQSQNVRIIEGHDSSLLDDGNPGGPAVYGYNFIQSQIGPLSPISPLQAGVTGMDNEAQNLYDSLERETVPNQYGAVGEDIGDTNTSEYYSLMATNSNGNISDSFWQQEEVTSQRGHVAPSSSSHHLNQNVPLPEPSGEQSPPRNFQPDHVNMTSGVKESQGFVLDGNVSETDPQDTYNMELSEEGLAQNTQIYAQPLSNNGSVELATVGGAVGGVSSSDMGDANARFVTRQGVLDGRMFTSGNQQPAPGKQAMPQIGISLNPRVNSSQPKNLAQNKSSGKSDAAGITVRPDVKVAELSMDQRQAGAGSSASLNDKGQPNKVNKARATGAIAKKSQIRRPAVQGSASAGDQKRPASLANSHSINSVPPANVSIVGKGITASSSSRANVQGGAAVAPQGGRRKQPQASGMSKMQSSTVSGGHQAPAKFSQANSPLASRTNSHTSLASAGSSNSRVGGVGKESHQYTGGSHAMNPSQAPDFNPGVNVVPHTGQMKHSSMPFNPPSGHPVEAANSQSAAHASMSSQRTNQTHPMQELHAGDPRSLHYPHSNALAFGSQNAGHGQFSQMYPSSMVPGNAPLVALPSMQAHQMGNFPSQGLSPSGSESSHHSYNREAVVTQMEAMKKGMNQSTSSGNDMYSCELQSIEDVRSHLHSMLHVGVDHANTGAEFSGLEQAESASELLTDQPVNRQLHFDTDSSSLFGNKAGEDMSDILENFPAFSSKMFSDGSGAANKSDMHVHSENQYLRENFEKERYRRRHCEDQIQRLNSKILEIQQQLAVAISTDKRKDTMIEQLDKQLAKVVEGWKKREADKDDALKMLTEEKCRIEESLQRQQAMINSFEHDLAQTVDELKGERTKSSETIQGLRKQLIEVTGAKEKSEEILQATKKKCDSMTEEWETMKSSQQIAEMRAQQAQEKFIKEQDVWSKKEQEYVEKIKQVKEANQKVINMEKVKLEEQKKKREAAELECHDLKAELKRLVLDTEQLVREKESQKMEVSIMEAKFESAQRKLEADLHTQMEKEIADQASEFHARLESTMEEAGERHRTQVAEIHKRHQKDMERQMAAANEEREKREEDYKKQISDLETRFQDVRSENSNLKQSKLKLESQRMEILTKLQFMMQSQWNEAVSLLVSTPQKKNVQSSFLSASGSLQFPPSAGTVNTGGMPQSNFASAAPPQAMAPVQHKTKSAGSHASASESGRKSSTSSSGRERNVSEDMAQLDRVEEYLQRLNVPSETHLSGDDNSQVSESGSAVFVSHGRASDGQGSVPSFPQHPLPGEQPHQSQYESSEGGGRSNPKQPLHSPSHPSNQPSSKHILTQLNGDAPPHTAPMPALTSLPHGFQQALPMRSPQQMSRISQVMDSAMSLRNSLGQFFSSSDLPLKGSSPSDHQGDNLRGFHPQSHFLSQMSQPPPHPHQHQRPPHQYHQQRQENVSVPYSGASPSQSNMASMLAAANNTSSGSTGSQAASSSSEESFHHIASHVPGVTVHVSSRDSGNQGTMPHSHHQDHHQHHHYHQQQQQQQHPHQRRHHDHDHHGTDHNPNLFSAASQALVSSSPSGITPISSTTSIPRSGKEQNWSPDTSAGSLPKMLGQSSPQQNQMSVSYTYNMESPVKWTSRNSKRMGNVHASLSPPVRQTAEKDQTDVMSDASSGMPEHRQDADYSHLSERMDKHWNRHEELQHYIQMLLQKAPGRVSVEPERDFTQELDILESSRDLTDKMAEGDSVDLDLNDTAQAQELTSQLSRLQELRERQQGNAPSSRHQPPSQNNASRQPPAHLAEYIGDNGVMNAQGLSEISQLLSLYREQWEANPEMAKQVNTAGQLIEALKGVGVDTSFEAAPRNDLRKQPGTKGSPRGAANKKPRDSSSNKPKKKSANQASADVSIATTVDSLERSQNSSKGGNVPATAAKKGQEVVKEPRKVTASSGSKQTAKGGPVWK